MKTIYVCIKQVPDTETRIQIQPNHEGIVTENIKWILSPYDEHAVEEALQVKANTPDTKVHLLSVGPKRTLETLRSALAMGADEATHIDAPETIDPFLIAKALAAYIQKHEKPYLIFTGKEAIDEGVSQVGLFLATALKIPAISIVSKIQYQDSTLICHREIEGGSIEVIQTSIPALISTEKGLNQPRYASLPNIMKAKRKSIPSIPLAELNLSLDMQKTKYIDYQLPPPKPAGKKIEGDSQTQVKELVRLLHEEAKVI